MFLFDLTTKFDVISLGTLKKNAEESYLQEAQYIESRWM